MNTRGSQLRRAKDEGSDQEKTGSNWETFLFGAIWPWNEGSAEAIITTRGGSAQVWSFQSTERESEREVKGHAGNLGVVPRSR